MVLDVPDQSASNPLWLTQIREAQRAGQTCLPFYLGLTEPEFQALMVRCVPNYASGDPRLPSESDLLRDDLLNLRRDEWQQLQSLLVEHRHGQDSETETAMASIVAAACLGGGHLWRDLGLSSRQQLRDLLFYNFPTLAARNVNNMRWKKFFYKQLCEQEGGYVCRSPTCEQCSTYQECFGEEH